MAEVLHWPHRSGPSFPRKSPWTTAAVRAPLSPYRLHRKPNPSHFRRGSGRNKETPRCRRNSCARNFRSASGTARGNPSFVSPCRLDRPSPNPLPRRLPYRGHVVRARCRRNLRGRGFRSDSNSARAQSYTCSPCRLAQRAAKRWFSIG
jgi:hypothetical protein